jgi:hypothetical protein
MSAMSATTADAVASPPAPGPTSVSSPTDVGVDRHRVGDAHHLRDGGGLGTMVGCTRCSMPLVGALRDAEQLDAVAELVGRRRSAGVIERCPRHRSRRRRSSVPKASEVRIASLCAVSKPADVEGRIGLGIAEPLRLLEAPRRRQPSCSIRVRM